MPTVVLEPSSVVTNANWALIGSAANAALELELDNGVSSGVETGGQYQIVEVELDNLDSAGLNIGSIDSIQATMEANIDTRGEQMDVRCSYRNGSGNVINSYSEDITVIATGTNTTYNWTARTTSDATHAWVDDDSGDNGDLDTLRLRFATVGTAITPALCQVHRLYLTVTYTEAVIPKAVTINGSLNVNGKLVIK
jgi:hypothetical protein